MAGEQHERRALLVDLLERFQAARPEEVPDVTDEEDCHDTEQKERDRREDAAGEDEEISRVHIDAQHRNDGPGGAADRRVARDRGSPLIDGHVRISRRLDECAALQSGDVRDVVPVAGIRALFVCRDYAVAVLIQFFVGIERVGVCHEFEHQRIVRAPHDVGKTDIGDVVADGLQPPDDILERGSLHRRLAPDPRERGGIKLECGDGGGRAEFVAELALHQRFPARNERASEPHNKGQCQSRKRQQLPVATQGRCEETWGDQNFCVFCLILAEKLSSVTCWRLALRGRPPPPFPAPEGRICLSECASGHGDTCAPSPRARHRSARPDS